MTTDTDSDRIFRSRVTASPSVIMQELPGDESVFLDMRTETYFSLDKTGTRMYRALVRADTVEEAYEMLQPLFHVPATRLRQDLIAFIDRLVARGALRLDESL